MPIPDKHVFVCTNTRPDGHARGCCLAKGGMLIRDHLKKLVVERELRGQIRVNSANCLGQCEHGVTVVVYPDAVWYGFVRPEDADEIFESHLVGNCPVERLRLPPECVGTNACPHRPAPAVAR